MKSSQSQEWQAPSKYQISISFDATIRNSYSTSSTVSQDSEGNIIEIWTKENATTTPIIVEAQASKLALKMVTK